MCAEIRCSNSLTCSSGHVFPVCGYVLSVHVYVHALLKQDMHAHSCFPFSYWKLHSITTVILCGFWEPNLIIAEIFSKVTQYFQYKSFLPLQSLCKSYMWQTTECWVLTSIRWSNHMWLTHQWSRINDCHLWLASISCGATGVSWVALSSLKTAITLRVQSLRC